MENICAHVGQIFWHNPFPSFNHTVILSPLVILVFSVIHWDASESLKTVMFTVWSYFLLCQSASFRFATILQYLFVQDQVKSSTFHVVLSERMWSIQSAFWWRSMVYESNRFPWSTLFLRFCKAVRWDWNFQPLNHLNNSSQGSSWKTIRLSLRFGNMGSTWCSLIRNLH